MKIENIVLRKPEIISKEIKIKKDNLALNKKSLDLINEIIDNFKKTKDKFPSELYGVRNYLKYLIKRDNKQLDDLAKELIHVQNNCEHEFVFVDETYGGNFNIYECKKCGKIEYKKD